MKRKIKLSAFIWRLSVCLALAFCVFGVSSAKADLVAHYEMEEDGGTTLDDSSSSTNDGTLTGSPSWVPGVYGLALDLNGSTQYALVPDDPSLDITGSITLAAWVKPEKVGTQYLIKKATQGGTNGYELSLASSGKAFVRFNQVSSGNDYRLDTDTSYPADSKTWVHLAATYDGSNIRIYIDGVEEGTPVPDLTSIAVNSLALGIGAQSDGATKFQGAMDDVRIYNTALSATDIADLAEFPPSADLSITKDDGLSETDPGDPVSYTITVTNNGPDEVTGATVTDIFPAELTGVTWTCAGTGGGICSASGSGNINDSVDLANGDSVTYTVSATFDAGAAGFVRNTAEVAVPTGAIDPDTGNNTATDGTFMAGTGDSTLVAHYEMEENGGIDLDDSSFYLNDGNLMGSPGWATGIDGFGMVFDGINDYALVPDDDSLDITDEITLAAWVKPGKQGTQYLIKKAISGTDGYELSLATTGKAFVRFNRDTFSNTYRLDTLTSYPFDGDTWVHLAATYDGSDIRIYFNGVEEGTPITGPTSIAVNTLPLSLGAYSDGTYKFQGAMDDTRVYNRALLAAEIKQLAGLCLGDFDEDGDVDGLDLQVFEAAMVSYNADSDFNEDLAVNGDDLDFFVDYFGRNDCP